MRVPPAAWHRLPRSRLAGVTNHARVLLCIAHDPGARLRGGLPWILAGVAGWWFAEWPLGP
jgi:hypothetical protein